MRWASCPVCLWAPCGRASEVVCVVWGPFGEHVEYGYCRAHAARADFTIDGEGERGAVVLDRAGADAMRAAWEVLGS